MAKGDQLYYKALQLAGQQEYDTQEVISFYYYLLSALYGEPKAKYEVGRCYYYGIGVPQNIELGREIVKQFPEK